MAVSNTMNLLSMATGTNSLWVAGAISGPGGVTASGSGIVVLMAQNSYTGATTLAAGTLRLSASERIANVSPLRLAGGSLKMNGATETVGALRVDGASEIVFDNGSLTCAESTAEVWNGTLVLRGWKSGVTRFFVGNSASLSQAQLDRITSPIGEKAAQLTTGEVVLMPLGTVFLFR
jgi:autotransporter-associated beta strand protein